MTALILHATLLVTLALCSVNAIPAKKHTLGDHLLFNPLKIFSANKEARKNNSNDYEKFFDQYLDQMDAKNKKTFKQRYFVNKQWKSSINGAIHILYLEGEYTATVSKVIDINLPHIALAKDLGATVWSLEHRWRGKSQPLKRTFAANLRNYLSIQQAIEDIATFIKAQNQASKESNPKWIVVGSNYGGSLALWFRLKYPFLTKGVVSDSAPITPTIDFYQYERFVEEAYSNYSYECWHGIKFAALSVRNEIQYQAGVDRLNYELKLSPPIDDNAVDYKSFQNLHHNLIQLFEVPVVYNQVNVGPFSKCCGIEDVCKIMSNETVKDIERVYLLAKLLYDNIHGSKDAFPGVPNSYEALVKYLNNTKHDDNEQASARSWLWQQCHELGQFVTTDNGRGLFAATVPNDYFIGLCADVFDEKIHSFNVDKLKSGVKNTTLAFDTSKTYKGSNAVIFNGAHDPWSLVGVSAVSDSSSTVVNIKGVGHAAVLQPSNSNDPIVLKKARSEVLIPKVKKWVKGYSNKKTAALDEKQKLQKGQTFERKEENTIFSDIKNWYGKIEYTENGDPLKSSPSHFTNIHHEGSPPHKKNHDFMIKRKMSFAQKMRQRSLVKGLHRPKVLNATIHKHYLKTGYIVQDADHFNTDGIQFTQRFFKNDLFQRDRNAIRFLMLGAEAAIDWSYVDDEFLQYYRWAKDFKAVLYTLEHRFFGFSAPVENTSVEILSKYLTTEQVLADAAVFIKSMNLADNNTASPRWVVFGGSYGGNLVAAFRLRYPELSVGGIASSGPLQAKTDFYEYMQKVEKDIKRWGPVYCPSALRNYFGWVRQKLNTRPGRIEIKEVFCISNNWDENYIDEKDAELFIADMVFDIDVILQYDSENHGYLHYMCHFYKLFDDAYETEKHNRARKVVETMRQIESEIRRDGNKIKMSTHSIKADDKDDYYEGDNNYSDYDDDSDSNRYSDSESGEPEMLCPETCPWGCYRISYNRMLQYIQNVYRNCWGDGYCDDETRLWFWLTCSQWGYAESTNYGYNYFESALPINHVLDICADVFGDQYNRTRIERSVAATNKMYGGQENYNGTNCMFVNGSEDPWSTLSVFKPLSSTSKSLLIDGTSHCADMYREYEHDVQVLKDARKQIKKQIIKWVKQPENKYSKK